jgi:hypothetical protein
MTQDTRSPHAKAHAHAVLAGPSRHRREYGARRRATIVLLALIMGFSLFPSSPPLRAEDASPMLLSRIIAQQGAQLASLDSDESAQALFTTTIGPALGLKDAAGAVGAKRLPSKLVKELGELMAILAVWQFADSISHDETQSTTGSSLSATRQAWLKSRGKVGALSDLFGLVQADQKTETSQATTTSKNMELILAASRTAFEASQKATAAWWDIYGWKERARQAKGRARLCGTWQWIVHNHQKHGEQKAVLVFPPPGQVIPNSPMPAETIILGDSIYLRWEQNGNIQEDSLLFIKDDAKIEGSFMNNSGGWGPITGKRLAPCQP